MYKIKHNLVEIYKDRYLNEHERKGLRQNPSWLEIPSRTDIYKALLFSRTISDWNALPDYLKDSTSLAIFSNNQRALLIPSDLPTDP